MTILTLIPMPADLPQGGFIEVGEWDGKNHEYEDGVDFFLGSDGEIYARVCSEDTMRSVLKREHLP